MPAKTVAPMDVDELLRAVRSGRYGARDRVIVLLSYQAGLRACEIAGLTWAMVTESSGHIGRALHVHRSIAKYGAQRVIPLHADLRRALVALSRVNGDLAGPVVRSERGGPLSAKAVVNWFARLYAGQGLEGCSSHSGRRTFITRAARLVAQTGGSLRDLQLLAGHRSIVTTQAYIEGDSDAQRRLVRLL